MATNEWSRRPRRLDESCVADPLVSSSYFQMAKAVASSIGRWRVLDACSGTAFFTAATATRKEDSGRVPASHLERRADARAEGFDPTRSEAVALYSIYKRHGGHAMAGEALFLGWGQVVRGREQFALEVFQEAVGYYGQLQEQGRIERFEAYLLDPHGGDLAGFFLINGEQSALDAIRSSPEFHRLQVRAGSVIDNLGLVSAYGGDALGQQMALFGEIAQQLPQAK